MSAACTGFRRATDGEPWRVAWCAGAGVVASGSDALQKETATFRHFLEALAEADLPSAPGGVFLASSAGGVYAGSPERPPYDEMSTVQPLAPYGWSKLDQEEVVRSWGERAGVPVLIGRISNLYGPGQNHRKSQGLISQICLKVVTRQTVHIYVPLDTTRDYIYVDDAARIIVSGLDRLVAETAIDGPRTVVKLVCSQQPVTIGALLAQTRWITKRAVSVTVGTSANTGRQVRDLRMASVVWPELDHASKITLSDGMHRVFTDLLATHRQGRMVLDA